MRPILTALLFLASIAGVHAGDEAARPSDSPLVNGQGIWKSTPPADCPFPPSDQFRGLEFTGRHAEYTNADTWYPSWASDGNLYSPWTDGKACLVSQGASKNNPKPRYANCSWITGDEIYLARLRPSVETINDGTKYEFFAGRDPSGRDVWRPELSAARPTAAWNNNMGCVTITYIRPLKKYMMCVTDGGNTVSRYSTYLLEADGLGGPWKLVTYMKDFGAQAYFVNIPSKFIQSDGRTFWLCYAANFTNGWLHTKLPAQPPGSRYGMCLQEVKLVPAK
jgi:hypothetical protein